jgi:hypothetical protein
MVIRSISRPVLVKEERDFQRRESAEPTLIRRTRSRQTELLALRRLEIGLPSPVCREVDPRRRTRDATVIYATSQP